MNNDTLEMKIFSLKKSSIAWMISWF